MGQGELLMIKLIADAIKEAGPEGIPSGFLWAALMTRFSGLAAYESYIALLIRAGIVRQDGGHILRFVG